jgi:thiol-disulfide isomerase/thioredoxin
VSLPGTGALVAVVVLAAATALGLWYRSRDGRLRAVDRGAPPDGFPAELAALGVRPEVTLLQFSSRTCAPCRVLRGTCRTVAAELPGVGHVEVDAEADLDAARRFDVWRTPTLLILDAAGRVVHRAGGTPGRQALTEALRPLLVAA